MFGTITHMVPSRGFGFIQGEDQRDYFLHVRNCLDDFEDLQVGDRITFRPMMDRQEGRTPAALDAMRA